jgi:hypothetical protein
MATDLNTKPMTMKQRLFCVLNIARLLPDGCCCLNDMRKKSSSESIGNK